MSSRPEYWLGAMGKMWRARHEHITHEALPKRWVELLQYLDEKERSQAHPEASESDVPTAGQLAATQR